MEAVAGPWRLACWGVLLAAMMGGSAWGGDVHREPTCSPGCDRYGTCTWDPGLKRSRCNCPPNRNGTDCSGLTVPACRKHAGHDSPMYCGDWIPKSCACHQQCRESDWMDGTRSCYERTGVPQQISDAPLVEEPGVQWYSWWDKANTQRTKPLTADEGAGMPFNGNGRVLPLDQCPNKCSYHGECIKEGNPAMLDRAAPRCVCYYGYHGNSCELVKRDACWNGCGEHGTCVNGFCKCKPGHYGIDCFRCGNVGSDASDKNKVLGQEVHLRIYIYDLPTELNVRREVDRPARFNGHDPIYVAYRRFFWRLLRDCRVRTDDPEEANLFYVPALTYGFSTNGPYPMPHIEKVLAYIRTTYPYWDRRGGRDHIWWLSNDWGACSAPESIHQSIKLGHWGPMNSREDMDIMHIQPGWRRCFDPHHDVSVVPHLSNAHMLHQMTSSMAPKPRTTLFFFAGGLRLQHLKYSMGVRQFLWENMRGEPGFKILERSPSYDEDLRTSLFCLNPSGAGWGIRITQIVARGCIPVTIQPHVVQPFADLVPYWKFSVSVLKEQIPELPKILRSYSAERIEEMQTAMRDYRDAFDWSKKTGAAYEYTLLSLEKRMRTLHGWAMSGATTQHGGSRFTGLDSSG